MCNTESIICFVYENMKKLASLTALTALTTQNCKSILENWPINNFYNSRLVKTTCSISKNLQKFTASLWEQDSNGILHGFYNGLKNFLEYLQELHFWVTYYMLAAEKLFVTSYMYSSNEIRKTQNDYLIANIWEKAISTVAVNSN